MILLTLYLLLSCLNNFTKANSTHLPRMIFTDKETTIVRLSLPDNHVPVRIVLEGEPGMATTAGQKDLISFNFQSPQKASVKHPVLWEECNGKSPEECNYNIAVMHKRNETNQTFVCGTNGQENVCCSMSLSKGKCIPSGKIKDIRRTIREFTMREGQPSVLVESAESAHLYITHSGSEGSNGIYKFGTNRLAPANHDKEQHYVGLVLSKQENNQDKVYGFYREKSKDKSMYSEMWLPFVTQVCTADIGGPKNTLQFFWTSQMNARLFCGDPERKQHFSELVDVATVHAAQWQDTRIYALFRNEWGMSAVCVYKIQDIDYIFKTSPFKGESENRSRECVSDSTKINFQTLMLIKKTSEMEKWILPVNNSGPLLFNHHNYTHINVDSSQHEHQPVLFLSLNNGGIHKAIKNENQNFVIAEYKPFSHRTHVLGIILHPPSKKLYVSSRSELVQMDVANCGHYGVSCEECVLARDPYCGWNHTHCSPHGKVQDVDKGDHSICKSVPNTETESMFLTASRRPVKDVNNIRVASGSRYFLRCPVSSRHAQYTWDQPKGNTSCSSKDQQCVLLIDSMGPEQAGSYRCVSEEMGYSRVLAQYQLESKAVGHSSSPLVWVCLMVALINSLSCSVITMNR
ncbi:Semaphorin-7A [Larimichthys crocea]|uniref:Uncharacterized protein n=1 Tax=Larimichthys crocea TaxID=215358 RepID=A0ACD3R1E5_LARCR|nr:Semaphorin-7A [Larimichthys crocea]